MACGGCLMAVSLPPGVSPLPPNPPPPLGDADPAARAQRIHDAGLAWAEIVKQYVDRLWHEYGPWERWRVGTATGLDTAGRTVTVALDPGPGGFPAMTVIAGWGRPKWTAQQIVGKRVRVMIDTQPEGSRRVTIDDVIEAV